MYFSHFLRFQFPAIAWALLIYLISSIPSGYFPTKIFFVNDKIIHIVIFLIFGLLVFRATSPVNKKNKLSWNRMLFSIIIVILYGIFDEFHQGSVPGRTMEVWDAVADTTGGLLAGLIIYFSFYFKNRPA